jgi:hypothetical protein
MADEAILRLILQGQGGAGLTAQGGAATQAPRGTTAPSPQGFQAPRPGGGGGAPGMAKPLVDIHAEYEAWRKEMDRLSESLNPEVIRQRVKMEYALADARKKLAEATEKERERQRPTVRAVEKPKGFVEQLLEVMGGMRGTIGGVFGRVAGGSLDAMAAFKGMGAKGGAGAGGAAGIGALAGGIGGIVAVAMEAKKMIRDAIIGAVRNVGEFAGMMASASANVGQNLERFGGWISKVGEKFGIMIPVIGEAVSVLGRFMQEVDGLIDRYAAFSAPLAQAQAMAEVQQVMADMRRAQQLTPDLVRYVQVRTEVQQRIEDLKVRFMMKALPVLNAVLKFVDAFFAGVELPFKALENIGDLLRGMAGDSAAMRRFLDKMANKPDDFGFEFPTDLIMRQQEPIMGRVFDTVQPGAGVP